MPEQSGEIYANASIIGDRLMFYGNKSSPNSLAFQRCMSIVVVDRCLLSAVFSTESQHWILHGASRLNAVLQLVQRLVDAAIAQSRMPLSLEVCRAGES